MSEKKEKWMQEAFSKHPGRFRGKAKRAGKSTGEYAREKAHAKGALGKEARLALIGAKYRPKGKKKSRKSSRSSSRR